MTQDIKHLSTIIKYELTDNTLTDTNKKQIVKILNQHVSFKKDSHMSRLLETQITLVKSGEGVLLAYTQITKGKKMTLFVYNK